MTPEEQELISGVFDRLRGAPPIAKDADAERFIQEGINRIPDASYRLVQSVVIQQQALQRLGDRLQYLENLVADARPGSRNGQDGGSFLSGDRSGSGEQVGSVPRVGQGEAQAIDRPRDPSPDRAGGFLASALTTASGVAGGMLLTDGLRSLFGGHSGSTARFEDNGSRFDLAALDRFQDDAQDARQDADEARRQLAEDDAALDEAQDALQSSDTSAWDSGEA